MTTPACQPQDCELQFENVCCATDIHVDNVEHLNVGTLDDSVCEMFIETDVEPSSSDSADCSLASYGDVT